MLVKPKRPWSKRTQDLDSLIKEKEGSVGSCSLEAWPNSYAERRVGIKETIENS